ncbi:MAG TPA: hypothetical protein VI029_17555 [Mycobacterium sp.]
MSDPSKFWNDVWARIRLLPTGIVFVPQRAKWCDPISTETTTPVSGVAPKFSIRRALLSQPPLGESGVATKTTLGEVSQGLGFVVVMSVWWVS